MAKITLTVSQEWVDRFELFARDDEPWDEPGPDTRTAALLFREWVTKTARYEILNFERNNRAKTGGASLPDPT